MIDPDSSPGPGDDVASQLLTSSQTFARSGVRAYAQDDWDVFHLHLATAVEQLLKSVLARTNPLFIAGGNGFDSLLHLAGLGHRASTPASAFRTITVVEAQERVKRLIEGYSEPAGEVRTLLETRNAIVHAGAGARGGADVLLGETGRYINALLSSAGTSPVAYWGDVADLVETHTSRRLTAIESGYGRRIQAARDRFDELAGRLDHLDALRTAVEPSGPAADFSSFPARCPACGSQGSIFGLPSPNWEADWDVADGMAYAAGAYVDTIALDGAAFDCRVCGLSLYGPMLELAGINRSFRHDADFDLEAASEYFGRDLGADDY